MTIRNFASLLVGVALAFDPVQPESAGREIGMRQKTLIAYQGWIDERSEVFVMDGTGRNNRRLTYHNAGSGYPNLSRDGRWILFSSSRNTAYRDAYIMKSDGSDVRQLTFNQYVFTPEFSPDGSQIVFSGQWGGRVKIINADGSGLTVIGPDGSFDPTFSPDGAKIAFAYHRPKGSDIYLMNTDGTDLRPIVTSPQRDTEPSFSPDGTKLVYTARYNNGHFAVHLFDLISKTDTRLTDIDVIEDESPSFTPDGTRIVFTSSFLTRVHTMNLDGSDIKRVGDYYLYARYPSSARRWPDGGL